MLQTTKQICFCLHTLQFYGNMLLDTTTIIIFDFSVKLTRKTTLPSMMLITAFGRLELEWCERKIMLGWLELELVAGVV